MTPFKFVPHTADIAVELTARDEPGLYQAGLDALRTLLVGESEVVPREERAIEVGADDPGERLVRFLSEVLYLYETERFLPARTLPAGIAGEPFDPSRHAALREVKAVTYHGADVRRAPDGALQATIVFDV
ncbi:MAG: archease [Gemmatimonadales bacterium]